MLILKCSQECYAVKIWPLDLWPWKSIGFQTLIRTMYVLSLVKIHWRMLILECSQGCYAVKIWPRNIDRWPWKSIGFQTFLRTKYVPSLVKIHWRMDLDSRVFTRMLCSKKLTRWPWPLTLKINRVPDSPKYVSSLVQIHWRMLILECSQGWYAVKIWPLNLWPWKSIGFQTFLRTMYVPSLVKIHWRMLILEFWQRCYAVNKGNAKRGVSHRLKIKTLTFDLENQ